MITDEPVDVLVVGAGVAGLVAALRLRQQGRSVRVLEARDRVGGRTLTQGTPGGAHVDAGAGWIGATQTSVRSLIQELGLATFPTRDTGRNVLLWRGTRREYDATEPPPVGLPVLLDHARATRRLDRMARRLPPGEPWLWPGAAAADHRSFAHWMDAHLLTRGAHVLFWLLCGSSFGGTPSQVSLLTVLAHVGAAGGVEHLTGVRGGALEQRVVGGTAMIAEALASRLGDAVDLDTPVSTLRQEAGSVTAITPTAEVAARAAIVAMDPLATGRIAYRPKLPPARTLLSHGWEMGSGVKSHLMFRTPFWLEGGLTGQVLADGGPVPLLFDATPADRSFGAIGAFADPEHDEATATPEGRREAMTAAVRLALGSEDPVDYVEQDWAADPWSGGCVSRPAPGVLSDAGAAMRSAHGRIRFAGAEIAERWDGHLDGAVRSGEDAARDIDVLLRTTPGGAG